jgi:hypothetical protein
VRLMVERLGMVDTQAGQQLCLSGLSDLKIGLGENDSDSHLYIDCKGHLNPLSTGQLGR